MLNKGYRFRACGARHEDCVNNSLGSIDDHQAVALKLRVDSRKQRGEFAGLEELIAEAAKRALIGHSIGQANAAEVHEVDAHVERGMVLAGMAPTLAA